MRKQSNRWLLIWKLHLDINLVWLLVYVVVAVSGDRPLNRDVCSYLGERYWWLADLYRDLGKLERSKTLRRKAEFFLGQGDPGGGDPPLPRLWRCRFPSRHYLSTQSAFAWEPNAAQLDLRLQSHAYVP